MGKKSKFSIQLFFANLPQIVDGPYTLHDSGKGAVRKSESFSIQLDLLIFYFLSSRRQTLHMSSGKGGAGLRKGEC